MMTKHILAPRVGVNLREAPEYIWLKRLYPKRETRKVEVRVLLFVNG